MIASDLRPIIETALLKSPIAGMVPAPWLMALCRMESGLNPRAVRYEPGFYRRYIDGKGLGGKYRVQPCSVQTEEVCLAMSWGLTQIMGVVARERGFKGIYLADLTNPETNLAVACEHIDYLSRRFKTRDLHDLGAAWNGGNPDSREGSRFADKLMEWYLDEAEIAMSRTARSVEGAVRLDED